MKVLLLSTYDMGHQPFGLASPTAWLRACGHEVTCVDLSVEPALSPASIREAELIAFYLPMHAATRLAATVIGQIRKINTSATLCCFGLYAPANAEYLHQLGVDVILGGEFEGELAGLAENTWQPSGSGTVPRLSFVPPDRSSLPDLRRYPKLVQPEALRVVGYTEASRGCKHFCRHCPVVPVYNGAFRIVQPEVVLEDVRRQVTAGAEHITFGDPDFFNGPVHARRIVEALHAEFPFLTYDVTIKIEHILQHRKLLPALRETGCLFVTSAVESVDDEVLQKLEKGHTRADFVEAVELLRDAGLIISPTFLAFTPWTTLPGYRELLHTVAELQLIENVTPVQWSLRLLLPSGSRLLELSDVRQVIRKYDPEALMYNWQHSDPAMDVLAHDVLKLVHTGVRERKTRRETFSKIAKLAGVGSGYQLPIMGSRTTIPYLEEPWFC